MLAWLTLALALGVAVTTRWVPTAEELRTAFEQGQKFYASGAYDQAIENYQQVAGSSSGLLDEKAITVAVGEVRAPQDEVARYQIGNAYLKMAEEALDKAAQGPGPADPRQALAAAEPLMAQAREHFEQTEQVATEPTLKALARSRLLTCHYRMKDYEGTIREARLLLARYPGSAYAEQAMYDIGWSHFELEQYRQSVAAFDSLVARFPGGYRADRALFQIGEAYFALGENAAAITAYRRLVESQGLDRMSERELLQMKREKLAGLVDETALDLAAKALIRIGVCHERLGQYDQAAAAFERIATQFADERRLVEEAYRRQADMYYNAGDFDACIQVYRRAIEAQQEAAGRARMQLLLANRFFETGHFAEAIEEYNVFRYTYAELAERVGLPLEGAGLQIAKAWFGRAEAAGADSAAAHLRQAELELRRTLAASPKSSFDGELRFNLALALQRQGGTDRLREAAGMFAALHERLGPAGLGRSALFQAARVQVQLEQFAPAVAAYRQLIEECGEAPEADIARLELGLVLRDRGDAEAALAQLLAVRSGSPLFARSRLEAGQLLSARGDRERAIAVFEEGLGGTPQDEERALLNFLAGAAQAQLGQQEEALRFFELAAAGAGPQLAERVAYARGAAVFKLGRPAEAVALLDRPWTDPEVASGARRLLAAAHAALGNAAAAMDVYAALAQGAQTPLERAEFTVALAEIAYRQQDYARAIAAVDKLQQLDFKEPQLGADRPYFLREKAWFLAADAHTRLGEFAAARTATQAGLAAYPDAFYTPDLLFLDGLSALQLQLNEQAQASLEQLLRRFPQHANAPHARYYLAYSLFNRTQFAEAMGHFQQVVDQTPDLDIAPDALFRVGECQFNLEQYDRAAASYRTLVTRYPEAPLREEAMYNLAWCSLSALPDGVENPDMGPVEAALLAYLAAYPDGRYVPTAQYTLGEISFNRGAYERAHDYFADIERRYPDSEAAARTRQTLPKVLEAMAYREYSAIMDDYYRALNDQNRELLREVIPRLEAVWDKYPVTYSGVGALVNIGVCYQNLEEWDTAKAAFDRVVAEGQKGNEQITPQVVWFAQNRLGMIARR